MNSRPNIASPQTVGLSAHYEPVDHNNIPTPDIAVAALETVVGSFNGISVWEPAVGEGYMARALEQRGAVVFGTDIRKGKAVYGDGGLPFEQFKRPPRKTSMIVTNPPYGKPLHVLLPHACVMSKFAPVWLLLARHTLMMQWPSVLVRQFLHGYYPICFGLPYLKDGEWQSGGAFRHVWTKWEPNAPVVKVCQFLTKDMLK